MIGCKDEKLRRLQARPSGAEDPSQLQGEQLDPSQGTPGLCLVVQIRAQFLLEFGLLKGLDRRELELHKRTSRPSGSSCGLRADLLRPSAGLGIELHNAANH